MVSRVGQEVMSFPCYRCGACCRHVNVAPETQMLDRGDGICRYYDVEQKLCSIYSNRPEICRIDLQYKLYYSDKMSWDDFVALNLSACAQLESFL